MNSWCRWLLYAVLSLVWLMPGTPATGQTRGRDVYVATLEGVINPLSAAYLNRAIREADDAGASALVLRLDTPGGLDTSMRKMTQDILASPVPVIVYVAPSGARAASAGMFITVAAHVAAMAPGTNIGAAHPVAMGGGEQDKVMEGKVVEDAAASARSLAAVRGRNAKWIENAVRKSLSATADEALKLNVIDIVSPSMGNLLSSIDGRRVEVNERQMTLRVAEAPLTPVPMTIFEKLLHIITDPNIAYLLLSIGMVGIIAELYNPGTFIPGTVGVISLALAFVALGSLPISIAGVGLMILAIGLMIGELHTLGFGALGIGSIVSFVMGSLLLFVPLGPVSPSLPSVRVNYWVILLMTATLVFFFLVVINKAMAARKQPIAMGMEALIGKRVKAVTRLEPEGRIVHGGEEWSAESVGGTIEAGEYAEVVSVSGVIVCVKPMEEQETSP